MLADGGVVAPRQYSHTNVDAVAEELRLVAS
jgi:hypothetical protein